MSRLGRLVVLLMSSLTLSGAAATQAEAVHWHVDGAAAFHATGGTLKMTREGVALTCPSTTANGSAPTVTATADGFTLFTGTLVAAQCVLGAITTTLHCGFAATATGWAPTTPPITTGILDMTCGVYLSAPGTKICDVSGATVFHYLNPKADTPGNRGSLTLTTGESLTTSGPSCPFGTGLASVHQHTLFVTGFTGPIVTRTS